jgi:hypothetical protein
VTAVSQGHHPPDGGQRQPGWPVEEPAAQLPPEHQAEASTEITSPLPPVPPQEGPVHGQEHRTAGLPLLDLLAPEADPGKDGEYDRTAPSTMSPEPPLLAPHEPLLAQQEPYGPPLQPQDPYGPQLYPAAAPPRPPRGRGRPGARLVAALAAGVLLLAVLGIWALTNSGGSDQKATTTPTASAPTSTPAKVAGGYQFTQHAARADTDCASNAYGKVADFFRGTPCAQLDRSLYSTTVDGRMIAVSVSVVRMPTEQAATDLKKLADTDGTGNVSDLLRAGARVPGGPDALTDAGYASGREGATVMIAEADFADRAVRDEGLLDRVSQAALQLRR